MLNLLQTQAIDVIKKGKSLFLTGPPGVGKSYTLIKIIDYLNENNINYGLTAMTGCAAVLIKGQTLHSFLGIGLGNYSIDTLYNKISNNKKKFHQLSNLDTLIIDEISMMNDVFFEKISKLLSKIKNSNKPFGNIRLILIGDFYQLPPVSGDYCFKSQIWNKINLVSIQLTELIRQKDDIDFQNILNSIRKGKITLAKFNKLKMLSDTVFDNNILPTKIYSLKKDVDIINKNNFYQLIIENNKPLLTSFNDIIDNISSLTIECIYNKECDYNNMNYYKKYIYKYNAFTNDNYINVKDYEVSLTVGAHVMITRNINFENELVNGKKGIVIKLEMSYVVIKDYDNNIFKIEYYKDDSIYNNKYVKFMPLTHAYAITVHKSQGSTLDYIEIDASDNNFAPGQLYTALSRAKNMKNIKLVNISQDALIINKDVLKFYSNL